jgi:hypothetical protein
MRLRLPPLDAPADTLPPDEDKVVRMNDGARRPQVVIDYPDGPRESTRRNRAYAKMRYARP